MRFRLNVHVHTFTLRSPLRPFFPVPGASSWTISLGQRSRLVREAPHICAAAQQPTSGRVFTYNQNPIYCKYESSAPLPRTVCLSRLATLCVWRRCVEVICLLSGCAARSCLQHEITARLQLQNAADRGGRSTMSFTVPPLA